MGGTSDKFRGYANEGAGKLKKNVGKAVGSNNLEVEGSVQDLKGQAQVAVGKTKDTIEGTASKAADKTNRKL